MSYNEVLVFVQEGCPACHEAVPIVQQFGQQYQQCITTRIVDVHREGVLSDTMFIRDTPTIIGCVNFRPTIRLVGANDLQPRLAALYGQLADGSCAVKPPHDV